MVRRYGRHHGSKFVETVTIIHARSCVDDRRPAAICRSALPDDEPDARRGYCDKAEPDAGLCNRFHEPVVRLMPHTSTVPSECQENDEAADADAEPSEE
jgi:hypothetical protein